MKKLNLIILVLLFPSIVFSQVGVALPFLLDSPDARSSGRGETGTGIADDINAVYWNPAGLGFLNQGDIIKGSKVLYFENSNSYFTGMNKYTSDNIYHINEVVGANFKDLGTFALDFNYFNLGEFTRTYDDGRVAGIFTSTEFALGIAYGRALGKDFGIGAKVKYLQSNLTPVSTNDPDNSNTGSSIAFDFGFLWNPEFKGIGFLDERFFSVGINLQNLGPKLTYLNESEPLPTNLRLGFGFKLLNTNNHKVTLSTDLSKLMLKRDAMGSDPLPKSLITAWSNEGGMTAGFGGEYKLKNYFSARAGFFYEPREAGDRHYLTFGASGKIWIFRAEIAYIVPANNLNYLSEMFKFTLRVGG